MPALVATDALRTLELLLSKLNQVTAVLPGTQAALQEGVEKLAKMHDAGGDKGRSVVPLEEAKKA